MCCRSFEDNASSHIGVELLDQYLHEKYELTKATVPYLMLLRRPDDAEK